jgi:hypothetical protein
VWTDLVVPVAVCSLIPLSVAVLCIVLDWLDSRALRRELRELEAYERAAGLTLDSQSDGQRPRVAPAPLEP